MGEKQTTATDNNAAPGSREEPLQVVELKVPRPTEHGGPSGPEPTRYGDWERKGRCVDF
jgi:hypothetical protein